MLRIMTYNVRGWHNLDGEDNLEQIGRIAAEYEPDVLSLNEVFYPRSAPDSTPYLELLAARLQMHFVFGPCLRWPATAQLPKDGYGNALLSRLPITASAVHHLTAVAGREQRGLLEGRILLASGGHLTVYVTQLDLTDEEAGVIQLRAIRTWTVRDRNRPHLVLGDFNTVTPWEIGEQASKGATLLLTQMEKAAYVDTYRLFDAPRKATHLASSLPARHEYIFASQTMAPLLRSCRILCEVAARQASDHLPLLAEIELS